VPTVVFVSRMRCGCEFGYMLSLEMSVDRTVLCRYLFFACCVACGGVGETVFLACRTLEFEIRV
jgi:hypothetical protein